MSVMYREPSIIKKSKDGRVAAVDMASELLNSRVLLLEGEVNDMTCNGLIKSMLVLEHQSATEPITLIINSPGGSVTAGLALIDTMQSLDCPVITVGEGVVASMAAVILACGDHRQVYRHTQVLIHQLLAEHGNLSAQEFHELTERDCWCNAKRALELGLVDEVIAPSKKAL